MEEDRRIRREFLILLALYLLPAIYTSADAVDPELFSDPLAHLGLLIQNVPRILLLLYVMELDGGNWSRRFGLPLEMKKLPLRSLGVAALLLAVSVASSVVGTAAGVSGAAPFSFEDPPTVAYLLSALSLLSVGYMEELFFRSYTIVRLEQLGLSRWTAVAASALLFSLGHAYQGVQGLFFSFFAGIALGALFSRNRRVHPLALGHGVYNYLGLLFSGLS